MRNLITFVLGGGRGTRLYPLTKYRSKPAVPIGGKYRLIDVPLSNCINSGISHVYVLTQFLSVSLHRHIRQTYRFDQFSGGFVELLAAQQTMDGGTDWFEGTADAVRKNLRYLEGSGIEYVLILSGDQLYRMDYTQMLAKHQESGAAVTIAGLPVSREQASALGIMKLDDAGRVSGFVEKPTTEEELRPVVMEPSWFERMGITSDGRELLANMGIYLFNRDLLVELLKSTTHQDFGREVFPLAVSRHHVQAHLFDGYWEDIGTIRAFFDANISMAKSDAPYELAAHDKPVYTRPRFLPPAKILDARISRSLIADGCHIGRGSTIQDSIIGLRCRVGENVTIRNSVIFGDDAPEVLADSHSTVPEGALSIGSGSVIEGAIVDKNARIGRDSRIVNDRGVDEAEVSQWCMIRDGIPVVLKDTMIPDGWKLE